MTKQQILFDSFLTFLEKGCADYKFAYNLLSNQLVNYKTVDEYVKQYISAPSSLIYNAFPWISTAEGTAYWAFYHNAWIEKCKNMNFVQVNQGYKSLW